MKSTLRHMTFNRAAEGRKVLIAEQKTDVAGLRHTRLHGDVQRNKPQQTDCCA
ncbi:hypothetical protein [Herbaspirillum seropedicae]|uniref:hypothetical protein n=1 Tax=Herbaspirillum seropedicae TaxID=964 RepID=UPI003FCE555E